MEINNNSSIIKEVLSLRYCPSIKSTKNKFIVNDFMPEEKLDYLKHIENCISSEIKKEVSDNHVSVALSGGVDSTLVMALLRKTKPDIKIDAISLKFADSVDETKIAGNIASKFNADHHIISIENFLGVWFHVYDEVTIILHIHICHLLTDDFCLHSHDEIRWCGGEEDLDWIGSNHLIIPSIIDHLHANA